jgi:hypothetical protein
MRLGYGDASGSRKLQLPINDNVEVKAQDA